VDTKIDVPLIRDKHNNLASMEKIVTVLTNGCIFGKLCISNSDAKRTWLYNGVVLQDSFIVSLHKSDILKMIENRKRRILND